jgi:cation diffusion facilitator CzcD-associated flavoprotein CzcO
LEGDFFKPQTGIRFPKINLSYEIEEISMSTLNTNKNDETNLPNREHPVLILGAGLNGLAAAYELKKIGAEPVILDASSKPAAPWRERHDQLRLNTHRLISHLPGMRIPRRYSAFPSRDDMVKYLEDYEQFLDVPIYRNVHVKRIDPIRHGWQLTASDGIWQARNVIIATGHERVPVIPAWPGRNEFTGELVHAAHFGRVNHFQDKRVLVVGAGNSGTDVLNHLIRIRTNALWVSVRNGPVILPTKVLGIPLQLLSPLMVPMPPWAVDFLMAATERLVFGDFKKYNLPRHPDGVATRLKKEGVAPAFDDGFVSALKAGRVTVLPEIERLEGDTVHLTGGQTVRPDTVICATGYSPGLESLVGHLGVLNKAGHPIFNGPECPPEYEGLWFMGMTPRLPGVFYAARKESHDLAAAIMKKKIAKKRKSVVPAPALSAA